MLKDQYQPNLIKYQTHALDLEDAEIEYQPEFIESTRAWTLFETLLSETDWRQERIKLYGKVHDVPRLSCWMGDPGLDYSYSNMTMHPVSWSNTLLGVKHQLQRHTGQSFNSVLVNYYRDGRDSNGWHSDDEPELGQNSVIASLSLGAARDFHLRHKVKKQLRRTISLEHGSLLIMKGRTQQCWQHHIPKRARADARINLTFRRLISGS